MFVNCSQCNKEIYRSPYRVRDLKNHFCSLSCFKAHRSLNNPATRLDVRFKMSNSAKKRGRQSNQDGRIFKNYFCKICGNSIGFHAALYGQGFCKKCANKGIRNCNFGKAILLKNCIYNNRYFKSTWEANFAKWCDGSGVKWRYEPKAFNLGESTYRPDFYLPEFDCWIEIKGYWRKDAKEKVNKFISLNPNINFKLFEKQDLLEYGVIK